MNIICRRWIPISIVLILNNVPYLEPFATYNGDPPPDPVAVPKSPSKAWLRSLDRESHGGDGKTHESRSQGSFQCPK
jgi:hypothetical protein